MCGALQSSLICCYVSPVQRKAGVVVFFFFLSCIVLCRYVTPVQLICWGRRICFVLFFVGRVSAWVGFDSRVECACWCTPVFELMLLKGI